MRNLKGGETLKKKPLQKEINKDFLRKKLRARVKDYINKRNIGVNVSKKAMDEAVDFVEDILTTYLHYIKEINATRIYNETIDLASKTNDVDKKKLHRIQNKSITLDQVVDARHKVIRSLISQNML